jgi:hypothetical protein
MSSSIFGTSYADIENYCDQGEEHLNFFLKLERWLW